MNLKGAPSPASPKAKAKAKVSDLHKRDSIEYTSKKEKKKKKREKEREKGIEEWAKYRFLQAKREEGRKKKVPKKRVQSDFESSL